MNVDTAKLRQFINDHFGPEDLRTFLFDYFRSVYDDLTDGLTKSKQISLLLEYCHEHQKFSDLLAAIQRERPFFQPDDYVQGQKAPTAAPQPPTPVTRNPRQIFISHAHQDAEVAQRLAHDLEAHGYDIWIAPDSIRPGEKWVEAINRGLEESGIFVLLLSPDAVASRWVQMETNVAITYTHEDEMQLYPLMLKACRLPALWRAFQHISLIDNYAIGFNQLLAVLNQNEPKDIIVEEEPEEVSEIVRRVRANVRKNLKKHGQPEINEDRWVHPKIGLEMIRIPSGDFLYGDEEAKIHLDEFWIAKTPVTNDAYKVFLDANPEHHVPYSESDWAKEYNWNKQERTYPDGKADHPTVLVSWYDAMAFAKWIGGTLPTEHQWEKASRGPRGWQYPWGDDWEDLICNTVESRINTTSPVGKFSPRGDSIYGCADMAGNVWEWTDTKWSINSSKRVLRGGSWYDLLFYARSAFRNREAPSIRNNAVGFRIVMQLVSI